MARTCVIRGNLVPLRPLRPQVLERVLVLTTCVVALTAAMAWLSPAFSQSAVAPNMRGATWPDSQLDQSDQTGVINYGKPKPKKSKNKPAPAKGAKPLPGLNPYPGAPMIPRRGPRPRGADLMPPAPGVAAVPSLPHPNRPRVEDKPFEPTGLEVGSLRLKPFAEFSAGYDTNPNRASTASGLAKSSPLLRGELGFDANSEWSVHDLKASLRAGYSEYTNNHEASRPDGSGKITARIDVLRDSAIDLEGKFNLDTQRPGSPGLGVNIVGRPIVATYGAGAGVTQKFGRLSILLRGTIDRTDYQDAKLSSGATQNLARDSYNTFGMRARAAYEITPGISPFVEVFADQRAHDVAVDVNGFNRNSSGSGARVGSTFELTRMLTGELSAGYVNRNYKDNALKDMRGALIDGSLIWTATPLTTVTLRATSDMAETTVLGASGAISRKLSAEVSHALLRNLTLTAGSSWLNSTYQGVNLKEDTYTGTLKADYNLTRSVMLRASFTHERLKSTAVGSDYTANIFMLGLRLQR